jgi:gamma-glutamylcyclotransferase (GGCT)/AIG2-like uncharacterized protein YtfP
MLLPFFVYGTLRPGQGNYRLLAGHTVDEVPASLSGHALFDAGLPYVVPRAGHRVRGDLVTPDPARYRAVLDRLDRLEGFDPRCPAGSHYRRVAVDVVVDGTGEHRAAWVYLAGEQATDRLNRVAGRRARLVTHGDWTRVVCGAA